MKIKFKTLSIVSLLLLGNITNVCANDFSNIVVSSNVNEVSNRYNLKDIDSSELPEGIIPIEVDANNLESELLKFNNLIDSNIKNKSILPNVDIKTTYAAGTFTQGSSIELSCDGPIRSPYIAYQQGSLTYEYGKIAVMNILNNLYNKK